MSSRKPSSTVSRFVVAPLTRIACRISLSSISILVRMRVVSSN
jgi:hypothetical protein